MFQERTEISEESMNGGSEYGPSTFDSWLSPGNKVFAPEKLLLGRMIEALGNPPLRIALWDGHELSPQGKPSAICVLIRDRGALMKLIANPEYWLGEMYTAERIEVQGNLVDFLETIYRFLPSNSLGKKRKGLLTSFNNTQSNTLPVAFRNVHHHYDIGNDFYKLWLDRRMVYTCAYFPDFSMDLEDAQIAKMDHICRKLRLMPGETVVEAGCGWGALALHMAKHYGSKVKAYNISREQLAFARDCVHSEGLDGLVEFIEDDYRNIRGEFDAFVSVGMLEHVGTEHYREFGEVMRRSLKDSGRGLVHCIGRDQPRPMNAWIERHIFPGACPPSLSQMMQIFEPYEFSVLDVENLRLHYARTLEHWLQRFEDNAGRVSEMFDAAFVRTWRLYLAGSQAAFRSGDMQLFQVMFARSGYNRIPWTRDYQYVPESQQ